MRKLYVVAAAIVCVFGMHVRALAAGIGVETYLISRDGQLVAKLGDTDHDLLDPDTNTIFRFQNGVVTAATLDQPNVPLWTSPEKPQRSMWKLLPKIVVVCSDDAITGLDRDSGKIVYTTVVGKFLRGSFTSYDTKSMAEHLRYMVDDAAQRQRSAPEKSDADSDLPKREPEHAAILAQFDLASGKFVWKTPIVMPSGRKMLPHEIQARGVVTGRRAGDEFYFDPATGKSLDKAPEMMPSTAPATRPAPHVEYVGDNVVFIDVNGTQRWTVKASAERQYPALINNDTVIMPLLHVQKGGHVKGELIALDAKDGAEHWRYAVPRTPWGDNMSIQLDATKNGYLVRYHWLVLD